MFRGGFSVYGLRLKFENLGFRAMLRGDCRVYAVSGDSCSGFRVQGSGFRVQGSGQDAPESNLGEVFVVVCCFRFTVLGLKFYASCLFS